MNSSNPICVGTGLIALDVVISGNIVNDTQFLAGGSCGNVLTILSYLGWTSFPAARLSNNIATELLLEDLQRWDVQDDLLSVSETGSTSVIIHRIMKDKSGLPKHRFEFKNPEDGKHLPAYKPCLARDVQAIFEQKSDSNVFYFDRINRGAIELAKVYKANGTIIFFEPSSVKDIKGFNESLEIADVVKFSDDRIADYDQLYPIAKAGLEIQTLGRSGLKFRTKGQQNWIKLSGYQIDNVVDAAGAGDWCTAAVIYHLFKQKKMADLTEPDIIFALQFGQALSALNCTFEGARGLMYHIKRTDLLLYIQHIVESNVSKIAQKRTVETYQTHRQSVKISSLFTRV